MAAEIVTPLLDMFADTVTIRRRIGTDGYGAETYGDPFNVRAMIYGRITQVRDGNGHVVKSTVTVILAGDNSLTPLDEFTLPSRFTVLKPHPIAIDKASHEHGAHHETVYF